MTSARFPLFAILVLLTTGLGGCAAIEGVFKGGIWIGAISLFLIVLLLWWIVTKIGGGRNNPS